MSIFQVRKNRKIDSEGDGISTGERMVPESKDPGLIIEHLHRYLLARLYCEKKTVLDIACGEGYGTNILSSIAKHVTGVDMDEKAIEHASGKYKADNIVFKTGIATSIPAEDSSMDVVVSFETLEHLQEQDKMMSELKRVMKPDGLLIISTPNKKYYSDEPGFSNPFHAKELHSHEFRGLLERYFLPVQLFAQFANGSSFIYPFSVPAIQDHWYAEGDLGDFSYRQEIPAMYLIAFAGGKDPIRNMFFVFNGREITDRIHNQRWDDLLNSRSYRLGKTLSALYRWVKHLFS
jgi:ubiquinone/menaquinone biosynthesis C-methylase UbiE